MKAFTVTFDQLILFKNKKNLTDPKQSHKQ